jgi:hypothetical protein
MNELDILRNQLAQAIAGYRVAERQATHSLTVLGSTIHTTATQAGLHQPTMADRVAAATQRVNAGIQLPA